VPLVESAKQARADRTQELPLGGSLVRAGHHEAPRQKAESIDTMRRRTFMQVLGPGFLVGAAVACEINKTRNDNVKTGSDAKTALDRHELEYLQQAIHLSDLSSSPAYGNNDPFGAVLVLKDGNAISGHNHVRTDKDPTQHAELYTLRQACRRGTRGERLRRRDALYEHRAVRYVLWCHLLGRNSSCGVRLWARKSGQAVP
jgi:hypothetical protein